MTLTVQSDGTIERHGLGAAVLGDGGQIIQPKLTLDVLASIANAQSPESQALVALNATTLFVNDLPTSAAKECGSCPTSTGRKSPVALAPTWPCA